MTGIGSGRILGYNMEAAADDTGLKEATDILKTVDTYKSPSKVREAAVNKVLKTVDSSNSKKPKKIKRVISGSYFVI